MNTAAASPQPRRQVWPWVVGLFLTPFVVLGALVASVIHLNSDAAALRREFMAVAGGGWHTRVQLNLNPVVIGAVRTGLSYVHDLPDEAQRALRVVRSASVGVFEQDETAAAPAHREFLQAADATMARRGWTRVVAVADTRETVLIYLPTGRDGDQPSRVCLAVRNGRELVVVAAAFKSGALEEFVAAEMKAHGPLKL